MYHTKIIITRHESLKNYEFIKNILFLQKITQKGIAFFGFYVIIT